MTAATLLILLVGHFIGDFVCQSDRMASRKSSSWVVLFEHVMAYTLGLHLVLLVADLITNIVPDHPAVLAFAGLTAALHFLTDAITSRITARLWFFERQPGTWIKAGHRASGWSLVNPWTPVDDGRRHWFFVAIGFDQLLHACALAWAWSYCVA